MRAMIKQTKPHILIVDDDRQIRAMLARFLAEHDMRVTQAGDGELMFKALEAGRFDVIVLDVMMPGDDGFTLCRRLRSANTIPLILLTARNSETDRIVGLELGADDYVTKPFNPRELLARIRAILRRAGADPAAAQRLASAIYQFAGWTLDTSRRSLVSPQGVLTDLTTGEFDLLVAFVEHPQRVLNRDQLLDLARGRVSLAFDRSIDVQVSRLRRPLSSRRSGTAAISSPPPSPRQHPPCRHEDPSVVEAPPGAEARHSHRRHGRSGQVPGRDAAAHPAAFGLPDRQQ
jgi:two-component system OmpR family response regulator